MMKNKSQSEFARLEIERKLVFGELDASKLYSENKLASLLNLGRTPVREALLKLEYDNMLKVHPRKGIEFLPITPEQQIQMLEVRRQIEPICLRFAILRGTAQQKSAMLALGDKIVACSEEGDEEGILQCLQDIHTLVADSTGNPYFHNTMEQVQSLSRRFWFANKEESDNLKGSLIHRGIMRAVAFGDEEKAIQGSHELMAHLTEAAFRKITKKS
ncbi:GntR family transcriptional regulator [Halodesulfovibrio marinisediminis]|uniref:DNA-binding transcriptional regulator, GntR family n=1 Tax=Halodesulfovibrio marinisediminis DSM 17456 TaxID=1121457 RepID=A0A1N6I7Z7_9BACT|nr:GntR family transcriptional regulator [Halodesulfovibrio marinisediminis]SIO28120.1 DNA-binding transcriptional regulator, GntR family [Halodesulfovibrio marinisediminis DSM 17456]